MIVNVAGWVYIIYAALGLWSLTVGPFGLRMSTANLFTLLASALYGLIGYGLLKRDTRARWWALGSSLISWVIGGLFFVVGIAALIFVMFADVGSGSSSGSSLDLAKAVFAGAGFLAFFLAAVVAAFFIAMTVIFYKLFWYLCSREGCAEFGVEYGSAGTVLASVGAWIVVGFAEYYVTSSGMTGLLMQQAMSRDSGSSHDASNLERDAARQQTREALEREEERQHAAVLEEAQQALAQSEADERLRGETAPDAHASPPEYTPPAPDDDSAPPESEAPVPDFSRANDADEEGEKKTNKILKCRDKSGAVSYTQGYCPPGTTLVDTPQFE